MQNFGLILEDKGASLALKAIGNITSLRLRGYSVIYNIITIMPYN